MGGLTHLVWNLALAVLAVLLGHLVAVVARRHRAREDPMLALPLALATVMWLLVLPNTAYLFTEVRHLFDAIGEHGLWARAHVSSVARWRLAMRGALVVLYAASGALSLALAIRPVREVAREAGLRIWTLAPPFFALVSLGVYLGLVHRLNSWDVLTRPSHVLTDLAWSLAGTWRAASIAIGGVVIAVVYEVAEVWIDGAALRWPRLIPLRREPSAAHARG